MFVFMVMVLVCFKEQYFGCLGGKNDLKVGIILYIKLYRFFCGLQVVGNWRDVI